MDVFNAGLGDDMIIINASNIAALEKTITPPPLQVKWSVPNQMYILYIWVEANQCFCINENVIL
jgi:hypothetical protein